MAPGPGTGWTPPPKPGLIPLQPLTLGMILAGSFTVMRRNPRPTFGASLVIHGIIAVVSLATVGAVGFLAINRISSAVGSGSTDITAGGAALTGLSTLVGYVLALIGGAVLQGIISLEVARATVGEKLRFGQLWSRAKGRLGALIGWAFIAAGAILVAVVVAVVVVVLVVLAATPLGTPGIILDILAGLAMAAALVVLGAWIGTKLSLVPSILLLERTRLLPSVRRSWNITTGFFWRTLGIQLLVSVMIAVAAEVVVIPVSIILGSVTALGNPNGDVSAASSTLYLTLAVTTIVTALVGSVTAIISSATVSLIYLDLRMRKEGLDLDLARFVEARQVGETTVPDPYLVPATSGSRSGGTRPE
jgi:hypothetical protein